MTNREYLSTLSNEKLASIIVYSICDETEKCEADCEKCCLEWLERVRVPEVCKGGIYQDTDGTVYMVLNTAECSEKVYSTVSVDGHIAYRAEQNIAKDKKINMNPDTFFKKLFGNMDVDGNFRGGKS